MTAVTGGLVPYRSDFVRGPCEICGALIGGTNVDVAGTFGIATIRVCVSCYLCQAPEPPKVSALQRLKRWVRGLLIPPKKPMAVLESPLQVEAPKVQEKLAPVPSANPVVASHLQRVENLGNGLSIMPGIKSTLSYNDEFSPS